ncbi:heterokaryon incompatibility protein-domain-containing protein, partial [Lasiosphaeris hirsuta]
METVNFALLKQWLSHCENSHAALCRPDPVSNTAADAYLQAFRLIDVTKRKIVLAQPDDEYVALSYVWGRDPFLRLLRSNESDLFLDGSLGRDNNPVPKTISHALEAVSRLGMRYLWVDALCIMQDNHAEKATAISAMDLIYARAALTIVAASGTHANAGLAGLEPHTRDPMPYEARARFPESRHEFVVARASPPDLLRRSAWNTRGWT